MRRVYVNEERCLGCRLCEVYCKFANSGEEDIIKAFNKRGDKLLSRLTVEDAGGDITYAVSCRHCQEPLCVKSCITGAMYVEEGTGIIRCNSEKCVGCWTCVMACPYGAIVRDLQNGSVAKKCELCTQSGGTPNCVLHCPNGAIIFEDRG